MFGVEFLFRDEHAIKRATRIQNFLVCITKTYFNLHKHENYSKIEIEAMKTLGKICITIKKSDFVPTFNEIIKTEVSFTLRRSDDSKFILCAYLTHLKLLQTNDLGSRIIQVEVQLSLVCPGLYQAYFQKFEFIGEEN